MKNKAKHTTLVLLLMISPSLLAFTWDDLWHTPDQQGAQLLQAGKAEEASKRFKNKEWQAVAQYRAGDYSQAYKQFSSKNSSDNQYNAGNSAAYSGQYQEAIHAYDKAIALNPNNTDAINNRDIVRKLMEKQNQQQKNSSSKNNHDDKNDSTSNDAQNKQKNNGNSADNKNTAQNNSPQENNDKEQTAENNQQSKNKSNQGQQPGDSSTTNNANDGQQPDSTQQSDKPSTQHIQQAQNEDKNQLLRRIHDDPGGLLRQKFLRDYLRRHPVDSDKEDS